MFEYNGTTYATQSDRDKAEISHLQTELAYAKQKQDIVENNLAFANSRVESAEARTAELEREIGDNRREVSKWLDRYLSAKDLIQEGIDEGRWSEDELAGPFWEKLADILNLNIATEREVTVTATWTLTVKTAKQSLSNWDFDLTIDADSGELEIIAGEDYPQIDISE